MTSEQNPYAGPLPVVQKVLIVCPVSLVSVSPSLQWQYLLPLILYTSHFNQNWKAEFHKWLGRDRVGIITCDKNSDGIDIFGRSLVFLCLTCINYGDFASRKVHQVLIIGYERLRTVVYVLSTCFLLVNSLILQQKIRGTAVSFSTLVTVSLITIRI